MRVLSHAAVGVTLKRKLRGKHLEIFLGMVDFGVRRVAAAVIPV